MRMFLYYAFHSVKNQLKKIFKTWIIVYMLVCALFGGIIGLGVGLVTENSTDDTSDSAYTEEYNETEKIIFPKEICDPKSEFTELVMGIISFAVIALFSFGADKSVNSIFLPADVNLLFAAPLKPQSVLIFRLMTKIGVILLSSVYISFNIPNLTVNLGLSIWAAIGFIAAFLMLMSLGKLFQILLYLLATMQPIIRKHLRLGLFIILIIVFGAFYIYAKSIAADSFDDYILSALKFFNHPSTRFIPIIGCLKMFCVHIVKNNILGIIANFLGIVISGTIICFLISKIKADFYEEALAKSQETAELQQVAEQQSNFVKRKKDRSIKIKRNAMQKGNGADVFFWKSMYNRFRFAHFKIFTKTSETYLLISLLIIIACKYMLNVNGFLVAILIIGGLAFFRTLGNPLEEDTGKDFFRLIPEKTTSKIFWSALAGSVNCLLDIIPAMLLLTAIFSVNPLIAIAWILFIISVDFYGSNVGTFINLSVPVSAGRIVKQLIQIMFIYFGLIPDAIITVTGFLLNMLPVAMIICAVLNFLIGLIFLLLTPSFIDFKEKCV